MNTPDEEAHIAHILTWKTYYAWVQEKYDPYDADEHQDWAESNIAKVAYLEEHGLPLTSEIKGL